MKGLYQLWLTTTLSITVVYWC